MSRRLASILIAGLLLLTACAQTPRERWVQQREAITLTQDTAVELHRANVIGDDAMLAAEPWIKAARQYNQKAYLHLNTDEPRASGLMDRADRQLGLTTLYLGGVSDGAR